MEKSYSNFKRSLRRLHRLNRRYDRCLNIEYSAGESLVDGFVALLLGLVFFIIMPLLFGLISGGPYFLWEDIRGYNFFRSDVESFVTILISPFIIYYALCLVWGLVLSPILMLYCKIRTLALEKRMVSEFYKIRDTMEYGEQEIDERFRKDYEKVDYWFVSKPFLSEC